MCLVVVAAGLCCIVCAAARRWHGWHAAAAPGWVVVCTHRACGDARAFGFRHRVHGAVHMVGGAQGHVLLPSSRCYAAERGIVVVGGGPDACAAHEEQRWCVGCVMVRRGVHAAATDIGMLLLRFTSAAIRYRNNAAAVPAYGGTFRVVSPRCSHVRTRARGRGAGSTGARWRACVRCRRCAGGAQCCCASFAVCSSLRPLRVLCRAVPTLMRRGCGACTFDVSCCGL